MPRRNVRRESSVGLIVTLIFFILTSIGLGVATYYGFTQREDLNKAAKDALNGKADADAKAEWYQFQALLYRTWLGLTNTTNGSMDPPNPDKLTEETAQQQLLRTLYGRFTTGQLGVPVYPPDKDHPGPPTKGQPQPDHQVVEELIAAQAAKQFKIKTEDKNKTVVIQPVTMAWDATRMRPAISYEDAFKGMQALAEYYQQQAIAAKNAQGEAEEKQKKAEDLNVADQKARQDEVDKLKKENQAGLDAAFQKIEDEINKDLAKANKSAADRQTEGDDALKKEHTTVLDLQQKLKDVQGRLNDLNERIAAADQKTVEAPAQGKPIPTDWKIVRMDRSGKEPFINLGSAQNVRPGLTFSIHGQGPDGKPVPASKGTLEVLNVVDADLSQAQVVSVKDAFKDPILPGDYLYNPIFHPGGEQHVVIAGPIHMHGTKGDDLDEFERLLQRQNVVVDGYVDPNDGSVKGRLTVGTDYLVLGDITEVKEGSPEQDSIKKLQDQARSNGVRIVSAREFLDLMGYHSP